MKYTHSSPKDTFFNLPEDKRERIVREALLEFAGLGYQRASLNNIVKRLGIAKGSVYRYFENKDALFLYIFDCFTAKVKQFVRENVSDRNEGDFLHKVRQVLRAGVDFIGRYPDYYQIYLKVLFEPNVPHREQLLHQVRLFSIDYFGPLCKQAQATGQIRRDISLPMIIFLLDAVIDRFLQGYAKPYIDLGLGLSEMNRDELDKEIDSIIEVLKCGLMPAQGR